MSYFLLGHFVVGGLVTKILASTHCEGHFSSISASTKSSSWVSSSVADLFWATAISSWDASICVSSRVPLGQSHLSPYQAHITGWSQILV